jgi:hypothetical protein
LAKQLGFAPVALGKLNKGGVLVHARGRAWGPLIFQDLFKKEQYSNRRLGVFPSHGLLGERAQQVACRPGRNAGSGKIAIRRSDIEEFRSCPEFA